MTALCTGINVTQPFFRDEHLLGVSLLFHTKGTDKDHDTALDIRVCGEDGILVAERKGISGHWIDKSSYLVSLDLKSSPAKTALSAGSVFLEMHPSGNDTWAFNYSMWMFFTDKTGVETRWDGKTLTQEEPSTVDTWMHEQKE